jgi:hypothetical protein
MIAVNDVVFMRRGKLEVGLNFKTDGVILFSL